MDPFLLDLLECPACHGPLDWRIIASRGSHIEEAEATCIACRAGYPVHEGIAVFLTPDLPRDDLRAQVDSHLNRYLREHPDVERRLLDVSLDTLAPADRFFRALVLEERGDYALAREAATLARSGLYTPEYLACYQRQVAWLVERLSASDGPVVDLASGRCELAEALATHLQRPIVATDFSISVLRRDRRRFESLGLHDRVSFLAFDARRTPFKDGAVETMITHLGLANIREPESLLAELRRVVSGQLLALSVFYPADHDRNAVAIHAAGLSTFLFHDTALRHFATSGWTVEVANRCSGRAEPTPRGVVLDGVLIDALPVVETVLEWGVLAARPGD